MRVEESTIYKNLISHIDINRSINSIERFNFNDLSKEAKFQEFLNDINTNNDSIEINLVKNKAYKEAVVMSLNINIGDKNTLLGVIRDEQKTFGGSKLFYLNDAFDKILVIAVRRSMEGKLNMVINKLNKVNDKISRLNSRIKRENLDIYMKRKSINDKKDVIINMINKNLRV